MSFRLPPYLKWRDGRPRWEPGPRLRHAFRARDLKDDAGVFLGLEAAIAAAKTLNDEVAIWRAGGNAPSAMPKVNKAAPRTCKHLWEVYRASPAYLELKHLTRRDYKSKIEIFLATALDKSGKTLGSVSVAALQQSDMFSFWEELYKTRGHTMANSTLSAVRSMFSYGVMKGWRTTNPARALKLKKTAPRIVVWTPTEIVAFVEKADAMGFTGVADAVVIGLHTGQRQSDVLLLEFVSAENGRARFKQGKTNARVSVPFTPQLADRIEKIKARRRAGQVAEIQLTGQLVRDTRGKQYSRETFGKDFRKVKAAVADQQREAGSEDPSILGKLYLDLRDTAVTRLAEAECTIVEIHSITGHELDTIHKVLKHYLAVNDRMADAAIAKVRAWMEREGIAL
ncbi:tyrosine-type recombinase/integrase [Hyphomicrobium sp. DY-1]|uniref:tyrosine-type recombinase/integrase n=1 Tax=Hyphomicrobium sp. DY-1 TaxID=3075650 RepID=UPI0039C2DA7C